MRQTNEQRELTEALRAIAGRYRVEPDSEGWPAIEGAYGRVETTTGRTWRCTSRTLGSAGPSSGWSS